MSDYNEYAEMMAQQEFYQRPFAVVCVMCRRKAEAPQAELKEAGWLLSDRIGEFCPKDAIYGLNKQLGYSIGQTDALIDTFRTGPKMTIENPFVKAV